MVSSLKKNIEIGGKKIDLMIYHQMRQENTKTKVGPAGVTFLVRDLLVVFQNLNNTFPLKKLENLLENAK